MATYLITGCSRGLGLELVSQLAATPAGQTRLILATSRNKPSAKLQELIDASHGRVSFVALDTTDQKSIKNAFSSAEKVLEGHGLDVLINNAGVMPVTPDGIQTMDNLDEALNTNVTSVHQVTSTFLPLLQKGSQKKVFNISTTLGSMTLALNYSFMPIPAYKISKAALNMLTVQYAISLEKEGFMFITMSPGVSNGIESLRQEQSSLLL
ncbi:MAG: hypothetical protein Q9170_004656 [Blastenia crenularia]